MRAKFHIHFRYTRQRNTTFTQLYHPAQKLEQRQKRLTRALNTIHIHRIQVFHVSGGIYFRPYLRTKFLRILQIICIRTSWGNRMLFRTIRMFSHKSSSGNDLETLGRSKFIQLYQSLFIRAVTINHYQHNRATGDKEALDYAIRLFKAIEQYSFDPEKNGYMEAFTKDWKLIEDMRLSDKDENEKKTMNTHLHILEPYTNLYRVWKDEHLKKQLRNLILIFTDKILDHRTYHLNLFFNEDWESKYRIISYGHDIEASWLLHEAAIELGNNEILQKVEPLVQKIAIAAEDGLLANGSLIYEYHPDEKKADTDLHWWVQAENVVGHFNLYQHFGDEPALGTAYTCWKFIQRYLIDKEQGEWHWSVSLDHEINREDDKAGFWKCPYHNGRMCMEIIERLTGE